MQGVVSQDAPATHPFCTTDSAIYGQTSYISSRSFPWMTRALHWHSWQKCVGQWKSALCDLIPASAMTVLHHIGGWNFKLLSHRPSHFPSMTWWLQLPKFSSNTLNWTTRKCILQYTSPYVVSTLWCSATLQPWNASMAVQILSLVLD
jgi:hypothetical protein